MLIDVKYLAEGKSEPVSFSENITVNNGSQDVNALVDVDGAVSRANGNYIVAARLHVVLNLNCDLCLSAFETQLDFDINEVYSQTPDSEKEFWELSDKTIDLKPAVIAAVVMNMPMKNVCSEDCKGLCPKCGHNLNEGDCGCDRGYVNPQFEKLLTLFND